MNIKRFYTILVGLIVHQYFVLAQPLTLHYDRPARYFEEALVIGNGSLGATVYGGYDTEKISLNDITLQLGGVRAGVRVPLNGRGYD